MSSKRTGLQKGSTAAILVLKTPRDLPINCSLCCFFAVNVDEPAQCCLPPSDIQYQDHRQWLQIACSMSIYGTSGYNKHGLYANSRRIPATLAKVNPFEQSIIPLSINCRLLAAVTPQSPDLPGKRSPHWSSRNSFLSPNARKNKLSGAE